MDNVNKMLTYVRETVQLQLNSFIGKKLTTEILDQIIAKLIGDNPDILVEAVMDQDDPSLVHLVPKNIYSALLIDGIHHIPYELVKDLEIYETPIKTYYLKDGKVFYKDRTN